MTTIIRKCLLITIITGIIISLFACIEKDSGQTNIPISPSHSHLTTEESHRIEGNEINLSPEQIWAYIFFEAGIEFGANEYEVKEVVEEGKDTFYVITSKLQLIPSNSCKPTEASAVVRINQYAIPLEYVAIMSTGAG